MQTRPKDEDFEVLEEVIEDFDYFYEDEEDVIRNAREIRKLKIFSIGIICFVSFLIVLFAGIIQMRYYDVSDTYVSKEVIRKIEYMDNTEEAFDFAKEFYSSKEVNGVLIEDGILMDIKEFVSKEEFMIEDLEDKYLNTVFEKCEYYISSIEDTSDGLLDKIELPDDEKYAEFNEYLVDTYTIIYRICSLIQETGQFPDSIQNYIDARNRMNIAYLAIQN